MRERRHGEVYGREEREEKEEMRVKGMEGRGGRGDGVEQGIEWTWQGE